MITAVGVPVEEALSDIEMNARIAVIHLERDGGEEWINSLEEGWRTQSVDQWVDWLTMSSPEDEAPNND